MTRFGYVMEKFTIYGDKFSGNCQKLQFLSDYLRLEYRWIDIDIMASESRTAEFLRLNPDGKVPIIVLADGRALAQSNAIMRFLGRDSVLLPKDPYLQAKVDEWMGYEQYSHEPYVGGVRFACYYLGKPVSVIDPQKINRANSALDVMEAHLQKHLWFVGDDFTLADLALLPYTRMSADGGLDLNRRRSIQGWIKRSEEKLSIGPYVQKPRM